MRRTEVLQGLRRMKFETILERWKGRELSQSEAAEILGMSERTFRRWRGRYEEEGLEGLYDRRLGAASARRVPVDRIGRVLELYRTRYWGFTVKHFHEHLVRDHGFGLGYTWTKTTLQGAGLVARARRRGAHRKKRPRRPLRGMMLHQDGSSHEWIEGLGRSLDLIVTLDDATSEIYSAFLVEEEGTMSTFQGLREVIGAQGLPCTLYSDRGSHYFHTPKAGDKAGKEHPDPGRPGARPARHRAHRGLFAAGAGALGAGFRHPPGPPAQGARASRDHHHRGGQPVHRRALSAGPQRPLRGRPGTAWLGLRARRRAGSPRHPVRPRGAHRRQRQHRALQGPGPANPAEPDPPSLRQGADPGAPIPRRPSRHLPRPALPGPLRPKWKLAGR